MGRLTNPASRLESEAEPPVLVRSEIGPLLPASKAVDAGCWLVLACVGRVAIGHPHVESGTAWSPGPR